MDKRMMIQKLQELHHISGELLQEMGQMGQREGYFPDRMVFRDTDGRYTRQDGNMGQRSPYNDPFLY